MHIFLKFVASWPLILYFVLSSSVYGTTSETGSGRFMSSVSSLISNLTSDKSTSSNTSSKFTLPTLPTKPPALGAVGVGFYNFFTSFVNQTRQTVPDIVHHGNFSMIQLALLFAIGSIAAGAAVIAAEGFIFRQHETDLEHYKRLVTAAHAAQQGPSIAHDALSGSYGAPSPSYGAPSTSYGAPSPSYGAPAPSSSYGSPYLTYRISDSRKKRDTTDQLYADYSYPQVVTSYRHPHKKTGQQLNTFGSSSPDEVRLSQESYTNYGIPGLNGNNGLRKSSLYTSGFVYPQDTNNQFVMLNRLGMKRKKSSPRRRVALQDDNDDTEYERGLPLTRPKKHRSKKVKGDDGDLTDLDNFEINWRSGATDVFANPRDKTISRRLLGRKKSRRGPIGTGVDSQYDRSFLQLQ